jgi:iron complex outermembrane receptor protein
MRILHLLGLLIVGFCSFAQMSFEIKGGVVDETGPIPYATVLLNNANDSTMVKATFTDSSGHFLFKEMVNGKYFVKVNAVGFEDFVSPVISLNGSSKDLKILKVKPTSEVLQEYAVVAMRPIVEVEADRLVFNVDKTINATGSNGYDLLRKAPGVVIDNNGRIILEGKSGIQIFVNGKATYLSGEDLTSYLKSLQSSNIDAIEIITQPSSKYDAAGNAGIIDIKLKKNSGEGTNGSVTAGYSYGKNHRSNISGVLNHRKRKSNLYTSVNNSLGKTWRFIDMNRLQEGVTYASDLDSYHDINSVNGMVGYDWFINDKHTFGLLTSGSYVSTDEEGFTNTTITPESTGITDQILKSENVKTGHNYQIAGNLNYNYKDTLGNELSFNGDFATFERTANSYQPNLYFKDGSSQPLFENNYRMLTPSTISIVATNLDYSLNFLKGRLALGSKYSEVNTDNTFEFYNVIEADYLDSNRTNYFSYSEKVTAGYINYARKFGKKISFQGGLRVERTQSRGELTSFTSVEDNIVERDYTNWFPSGGLTYNRSKKHIFTLNYSKRIQRPNYQSLNPFESQINELSYRKGNPFLQPQYGTNVKFSHLFKRRYSTSLTYSYIQDFFAQITDTLGVDKSFLVPRNVANQRIINVGASLPIQVNKWWNMFFNVNANNTSYIGTDDKFQAIDINTFGFYAQNSFRLPKDIKFEVSGWFRTPSIWGGTYLTKSMGSLNLAAERKFLNDMLVARISMSDVFFTSPWRADLQYGVLTSYGTGGRESRKLDITVTYRLGNQKLKKYRDRNTSLDEEKNRTQ